MSHLTPPTPSTAPTVTITRLNAKSLRDWRERSGLTQEDLANALGLAKRTVQRMESGARSITKLHTLALRGLEALSRAGSPRCGLRE